MTLASSKKNISFWSAVILLVISVFVSEADFAKIIDLYEYQVVPASYQDYQVVDVVDGDTIKVWISGEQQIVRLVGIDTPETKHPSKSIECYGKEASEYVTKALLGKKVLLEIDESQGNTDRYDRLLRYVTLEDQTISINEELVSQGYARVYMKAESDLSPRLIALEKEAQQQERGLWKQCETNLVK